jgi:hypothetical protein
MEIHKHTVRTSFEIVSTNERPNIAVVLANQIDNFILKWCEEHNCLSSEAQTSVLSEEKDI